MSSLPKVLVVDDLIELQRALARAARNKLNLLFATTLADAEWQFLENPDLSAICLDGCVESTNLDTLPLLKLFRETFTGPIIATASLDDDRAVLMQNGCSHEVGMKHEAIPLLLTLLKA